METPMQFQKNSFRFSKVTLVSEDSFRFSETNSCFREISETTVTFRKFRHSIPFGELAAFRGNYWFILKPNQFFLKPD